MKNNFNVSGLSKFVDISGLGVEDMVNRKQYISELSINVDEERTCIAKINTIDIDSDGEIVMPSGCDLSRYKENSIVCWSHDYSIPAIGKVVAINVNDDGIEAKIKFAETERGNEIWQLVKAGIIKGNSIGFITKSAVIKGTKAFEEYVKEKSLKVGRECKRIITDWMLIENSIVNIGSNPSALMQAISAKSLDISEKFQKELGLGSISNVSITEIAKAVALELKALEAEVLEKVETVVEPVAVVEPVKEVVPVVAPVVKEEPKPVVFTIVDTSITLSEDDKNSIISELREERKKMFLGKIV